MALRDDRSAWDISSLVPDVTAALLGRDRLAELRTRIEGGRDSLPLIDLSRIRIGPPLRPGKIVCVGLNYRDHAAESGLVPPEEPVLFLKPPDTVVGPHDTVLVPRGSRKTDYEVELAVVVGERASYLDDVGQAMDHVAGYTISDDVSERHFQLERGGQWDKGKSSETFNPLGPWLVTADEISDPQALDLHLSVDGEMRQTGSTSSMLFDVATLVHYISQFMVLHPGDVINTGTPAGVALGRGDHAYLRAGQVVEACITGLGRQRHPLAAHSSDPSA